MMKNYPYIQKPGTLKDAFAKIQITNIPDKYNQKHLQTIGFKSSNDRPIISTLKFLKFIDAKNTPTNLYTQYRNRGIAGGVLAKAVKESYADLYSIYPDAHNKDIETLRNFFSANTGVGVKALKSMTSTFKALCEIADFEKADVELPVSATAPPGKVQAQVNPKVTYEQKQAIVSTRPMPNININIELQIPATSDGDIYDKFFAAMKKHILDIQDESKKTVSSKQEIRT